MTEHDRRNIDAVRGFYQSERAYAAPDIVWHVPGHNPVSGEYRGADAYFEVMPERMAPLTTWDLALGDFMVNGDRVTVTFTLTGERKGVRVELRGAHHFRLNDAGQVAEGWGFTNDQDALDTFFSA
jgi:ketosteroid isomerase-like protein